MADQPTLEPTPPPITHLAMQAAQDMILNSFTGDVRKVIPEWFKVSEQLRNTLALRDTCPPCNGSKLTVDDLCIPCWTDKYTMNTTAKGSS